MAFTFENLQVYQKAVAFADQVAGLTEQFPRGCYFLVDHLNRGALSIEINLAEGNGRLTKADRRNFFTIARGSAQECVPLLEIARRRGRASGECAVQDARFASARESPTSILHLPGVGVRLGSSSGMRKTPYVLRPEGIEKSRLTDRRGG